MTSPSKDDFLVAWVDQNKSTHRTDYYPSEAAAQEAGREIVSREQKNLTRVWLEGRRRAYDGELA